MYPLKFPKDHWYVAALSNEVSRELRSRWILNEPICLYRTLEGVPVAMVDRCIHRQMPLSKGRLREDKLECGYHGITYDTDGRAVRIPSQDVVPPACRVRTFPVLERGGLVWIWMGDPLAADASKLPDLTWLESPERKVVSALLPMKARAQLLNENLLDLSHLTFLHPESIGSDQVAEIPVTTEFGDDWVRATRVMTDVDCPPFFTKVMGLSGRIDRGQVAEFTAPSFHITHVSAKPAGSSDDEMCEHKVIHCITPERTNSAHYFWLVSRSYAVDDPEVDALWTEGGAFVFGQDVDACEAIEGVISAYEPDYPVELNMRVDGGPLRARRIIEGLVEKEEAAAEGTPVR